MLADSLRDKKWGRRQGTRVPVRTRRLVLEALEDRSLPSGLAWSGFARDAQHTALSAVASQTLAQIAWSTPVDLNPHYHSGILTTHYGSPLITEGNTVIIPVKTGLDSGFQVEAHSGADGSLLWTAPTDYRLPPSNWIPSYNPVLAAGNRVYFPGAGGTLYYIDNPDQPGVPVIGQVAFYGIGNYDHSLDGTVFINTPITSDSAGDLYFGFQVTGSNVLNLQSGLARLAPDGTGTWIAARTAVNDSGIQKVVTNSAPALSNDESTVYYAVNTDNFGRGYLVAADSTTLGTQAAVRLLDPKSGGDAKLGDDGTSSPTVGPDGNVFFGVSAGSGVDTHCRGWSLQFTGDLQQNQPPGAFGWDDTLSIVPSSIVPSYQGSSAYLLMSKYNNYGGCGGDGVNKIAVLDPNAGMIDPVTGITVMNEVLTIAGVTPDPDFPNLPGAVREWCINNAVVDPYTGSILANSEDGSLYRWDLASNSFTEGINLTTATGEAYTPTVIGPDGTVYAINRARLYAVRASATTADPTGATLAVGPLDVVVRAEGAAVAPEGSGTLPAGLELGGQQQARDGYFGTAPTSTSTGTVYAAVHLQPAAPADGLFGTAGLSLEL